MDLCYAAQDVRVFRIALDLGKPGWKRFITPWLILSTPAEEAFLVDPGPARTIPQLISSLEGAGVRHLKAILLTHIHIDHAGGTAALLKAFPGAKVIVHPRGRAHLIDPSRLWSGSLETLGELAEAYGRIDPVPCSALGAYSDLSGDSLHIEVVETPGHSPHHQSYILRRNSADLLFAGEAGGVYLGEGYLRPATPPRFFYKIAVQSVRSLTARTPDAAQIFYGHYGHSSEVKGMLAASISQLSLWEDTVSQALPSILRSATQVSEASAAMAIHLCLKAVLSKDANLRGLASLPEDVQDREAYFLENSVKGFLQESLERTGQENRGRD